MTWVSCDCGVLVLGGEGQGWVDDSSEMIFDEVAGLPARRADATAHTITAHPTTVNTTFDAMGVAATHSPAAPSAHVTVVIPHRSTSPRATVQASVVHNHTGRDLVMWS